MLKKHLPWLLLCSACGASQPSTPAPQAADPPVDALSRAVGERVREQAQRHQPSIQLPEAPVGAPVSGPPTCTLITAADLDGDGAQEIVCWSDGRLSFWQQTEASIHEVYQDSSADHVMPGEPNIFHVADFDHDQREELFIGWGESRSVQKVPITVTMVEVQGESGSHQRRQTVLYRTESPRAEVVGLGTAQLDGVGDEEIFVAHFDSQYFVLARRLIPQSGGSFGHRDVLRRRMATTWLFQDLDGNGQPEWVVGRPYGDEKLAPGDLLVYRDGNTPETVPTQLGLRSIGVGRLRPGGAPELLFGDGWHYRYGTDARGRLSRASQVQGKWESQLIEDTQGQYEIGQIRAIDLERDGVDEVIAAGNKEIRLWRLQEGEWKSTRLADGDQFVVAALQRPGEYSLVVPGSPVQIRPL